MREGANVVERLTRSIAASGLDVTPPTEPTEVPGPVWEQLLARIQIERMTGLAIESAAAGSLRLSDVQAAALLAEHRGAMAWCLGVERKVVRLAGAFDAVGIGFAVLKGASVAHTMYAEPCLRSFADVDLLVSTADYERACAVLGGLGHVRQRPEPRPGFEVRFGKASVHKHPDDGIEVDLHRTLVLGPFGLWIRPEELLERRETFLLAGQKVSRLDDTGMLLNVAMHASLGWWPPRLVPLRDVLEVPLSGEIEWDVLLRWAESWRLSAVLQHAFATATATLGVPPPREAQALGSIRPPRSEVRSLAAYIGEERRRGGTTARTVKAIPGVRAKVAYIRALALPDREFLEARMGEAGASYRRRWVIAMRRYTGRPKRIPAQRPAQSNRRSA